MNDDEARIRAVLDQFARALHDRDAAGAIAPLADDAVVFDLAPPLRMGPDAARDPGAMRAGSAPGRARSFRARRISRLPSAATLHMPSVCST